MSIECVTKRQTARVRLFNLDGCDRMIVGNFLSVLDWNGFETISFANRVDAGEEEQIIGTDGSICYYNQACPVDKGVQLTFTECTENAALMALAGYGSMVPTGTGTVTNKALTSNVATITTGAVHGMNIGDTVLVALTTPDPIFDGTYVITSVPTTTTFTYARINANVATVAAPGVWTADGAGFDRTPVNCNAGVAMEILFKVPGLCSSGGSTPKVVARLYPKVKLFTDSSDRTINGKNVMRGTYTAQGVRNASVFANYATSTPTGEMAHWAAWKAAVNSGSAFYYDRLIDQPTLTPVQGCSLRALV